MKILPILSSLIAFPMEGRADINPVIYRKSYIPCEQGRFVDMDGGSYFACDKGDLKGLLIQFRDKDKIEDRPEYHSNACWEHAKALQSILSGNTTQDPPEPELVPLTGSYNHFEENMRYGFNPYGRLKE